MGKDEYAFYKSIGICVRCHKRKAEPNKVMCMECADKDAEYTKRRREMDLAHIKAREAEKYQELKESGICVRCKRRAATPGYVDCPSCRGKVRRKRYLERQDIERSERPSYGLCYICGSPVVEGKKVCESCYEKRLKAMEACLQKRPEGFNDYWKSQNHLIYAGRRGCANGSTD